MCGHTKFHQNRPDVFGDIAIIWFSRWPPSTILNFAIFYFLVNRQIGSPNMHRHTKFHQNRLNGYWDIAFNNFQNGGRLPSRIFKSLIFWLVGNLCWTNVCHHAKFCQNWLNGFWDITIFVFSRWPPILKFLVDRHIAIPNFTKIGQTIAAFNNFQNGGRPPSWIFKSLFFWSAVNLWRINMCYCAKFRHNLPNGFWDIVIVRYSIWLPSAILNFEIFCAPMRSSSWVGGLRSLM